jgi:hypothetical protein
MDMNMTRYRSFRVPSNLNLNSFFSSSMNNSMPMMTMAMMPFHSAIGFDMLWFQSWMPE